MPLPLLAAAAPGLIQAGASLFGGGKRRAEQKAAQQQFDADQASLRNFQFTNPNANLENTAEDLTVNTQAAQFKAQQTDANLSQGLDAIVAGGGGGGDAQSIAAAALQASQGASASIASQEQANQQLRAQQAASNQAAEARGEAALQQQQYGQLDANFSQSGQRLGAANAARQQATQALVSGLGSAAGGVLGAGGDNLKAGLNFFGGEKKPETPLERSPLKSTGTEGSTAVSYNAETKRYEGGDINRGRTGQVVTGQGRYGKLRSLYGDSSYAAGGDDSKRLSDTAGLLADRAAYQEKHGLEGKDYGAFSDNYAERDSELGKKWLDRQLATQSRVQEDEAEFRAGQDEAFGGLDDATRRGDVANLERKLRGNKELWSKLTGDSAARNASGDVFRKVFHKSGGAKDLNSDQFHQVLAGLEKAGVNPKEYLRFLNTEKKTPMKRTPFYRSKWMGGVSK